MSMPPITLYNTLTRSKSVFQPIDPDHVRLYVCGPTVYDLAHIGNARPVVVFDVLYRLLQTRYAKVTYVRNVTDVDDKINAAAHEQGVTIREITERTLKAYHEDMAALQALPPTHEPRATEHMPQMIHMIERLIERGHAYAQNDHVYFDTQSFAKYGRLSNKQLDQLKAGARIDISEDKRHAADFVLWKPSQSHEPGWESPFGFGRPGWHIECSAMSAEYLGETFDIHGGGIDLVFPHHENEIAQSCCAHGNDAMAHVWMHNGHVMVDGAKMSKSLGNVLIVHDVLKTYSGEVLRYALLSSHYRQPLDLTHSVFQQAKASLDKLYRVLGGGFTDTEISGGAAIPDAVHEIVHKAEAALCDDLNTPLYFSYMHQIVSLFHSERDPAVQGSLAHALLSLGNAVGLLQHAPKAWFEGGDRAQDGPSDDAIEALIQARRDARAQRDFKQSDVIRDQLKDMGIVLEDGPTGTTWRRV